MSWKDTTKRVVAWKELPTCIQNTAAPLCMRCHLRLHRLRPDWSHRARHPIGDLDVVIELQHERHHVNSAILQAI